MMQHIPVRLKTSSYSIVVGHGASSLLASQIKKLGLGTDAVIITNPLVKKCCAGAVIKALLKGGFTVKVFEVADSEKSKSVKVAFDLVEKIARYGADKKIVVVALGGGVVGDLAGFVASVYKRGVPFIQVPTTLLAQVDSSIGGKVAVDLPAGKNLVGAFYQPRLVVADTSFLSTLSDRQISNGLSEAVKYGVIKDVKLFAFIERNFDKLLARDAATLAFVVGRCAAIKADIVSKDEKETKGIRTILNFGHTVGHAVETAAGYDRYQHGEAVALGMRAACALSVHLKLMKPLDAARVETLLSAVGLPECIEGVGLAKILKVMPFDKKFVGKKNRFVLGRGMGAVVVREGVPAPLISKVIKDLLA
jgi:3-dehydroquinate synthase